MTKGEFDVATQSIDGPRRIAMDAARDEAAQGWLADGRLIVSEWAELSSATILSVDPAPGQRLPLASGNFDKDATPSVDGRWLAVCGSPTGTEALYVQALAADASLQRVATLNGPCDVRWSAGTRTLAFLRASELMTLDYDDSGGRFVPLRETKVTTLPQWSQLYGIARDGSRFLVGIPPAPAVAVTGIRVILDGIAALTTRPQ